MAQATRAHTQGNTAGAVVVTPTGSFWPGHKHRPGQETPPIATVLDYAARGMSRYASVVFAGVRPPERPDGALRESGWRAWHAGPWTVYRRDGHEIAIGYLDAMGEAQLGTLFDATTAHATIADRLHRYGALIGYTWIGTPSTTALAALRVSWENTPGKPLWRDPCPIEKPSSGALIWQREATRGEAKLPIRRYDINGMYLSAAGMAEVAYSHLVHTGARLFDPKVPGYWLVPIGERAQDDPFRPPLVDGEDLDRDGRAWVTTPVAQWLQQRYGRLPVADSWTGEEVELGRGHGASCRVFRRWSDTLRDARARARGTDIELAIKRTYAAAIGGLRRDTMPVYRPDWSHTVIDLARVNMLRRIHRVFDQLGVWPIRVNTDEVTYLYDDAGELERHLGVDKTGRQLGAFKPSGGAS